MPSLPNRRAFLGRSLGAVSLISLAGRASDAAFDDAPSIDSLSKKAVTFLRPRQNAEGAWSGDRNEPGITALVLTGLLRSTFVDRNEPVITKGLAYLEKFVGKQGGLSDAPHSTYATSVALMAFQEANKDGKYTNFIESGQKFLKGIQWDESEGKDSKDPIYGGVGYGGDMSRPDMSNTAFMIEALRDSGLPADDPALKKALIFVSRNQNLKSEFNDQPWADKVNDGGFIYVSPGGGRGQGGDASKKADAPLRSSAGMTYAGLKSMLYAGLKKDDPRVKAAIGFIRKNYTLEENPGQGQGGLYYYYQTFAKAMVVLDEDPFVDAEGKKHDWRADLVAALAKRQDANGSWVNKADRFMEGDPNITTPFSLMALAAARPKKK